tara:strand:- start:666 stop:815 length:150 start_codon:yes stop_codon:yes gene_type:complete
MVNFKKSERNSANKSHVSGLAPSLEMPNAQVIDNFEGTGSIENMLLMNS